MLAGTALMTTINSPLCVTIFPGMCQVQTQTSWKKDIQMHYHQAAMILQFCTNTIGFSFLRNRQ